MIKWLFFVIAPVALHAQQKALKTFDVGAKITFATIDRPGDFYLVLEDHQLLKYDQSGNLLARQQNNQSPATFDPSDGARLFSYNAGAHRYMWLTPTLEVKVVQPIDSSHAIEPQLACPAGTHHLIVLDNIDATLKKIDITTGLVDFEVPVEIKKTSTSSHFIQLREYQNFVFLLDENSGILIYNTVGILIRRIEMKGLRYFNFLGEELYYKSGVNLHFFDLLTAEQRDIALPAAADFALLTDEYLLLTKGKQVSIYSPKP